jgi:hypothetical protein
MGSRRASPLAVLRNSRDAQASPDVRARPVGIRPTRGRDTVGRVDWKARCSEESESCGHACGDRQHSLLRSGPPPSRPIRINDSRRSHSHADAMGLTIPGILCDRRGISNPPASRSPSMAGNVFGHRMREKRGTSRIRASAEAGPVPFSSATTLAYVLKRTSRLCPISSAISTGLARSARRRLASLVPVV